MQLAVLGNDDAWQELVQCNPAASWLRAENPAALFQQQAAAFFNLDGSNDIQYTGSKPYFIHAVNETLVGMNASPNTIRINAWKGFLSHDTWEVCGNINALTQGVLALINKKYIALPDTPGFISARIIAMIVNEAYFAAGDKISTSGEIDTAMKLGTNYPYGPFEWGQIIGLQYVQSLLQILAVNDSRYMPAPALMHQLKL